MNPFQNTTLVSIIAEILGRAAESTGGHESIGIPSTDYESLAKQLIAEAIGNGLISNLSFTATQTPVSEGATAEHVSFTTAGLNFVLKVDGKRKLALEANNLSQIRIRDDLPPAFREMFPRIFAVKADTAPYAYLMERFTDCSSFSTLLFKEGISVAAAVEIAQHVLEKLAETYQHTKNNLLLPNIVATYLDRIEERLAAAAALDNNFKRMSQGRLRLNGQDFYPPAAYIERLRSDLSRFGVGFSTFVHGDCHPENILVGNDFPRKPDRLYMIDPKEWWAGDYLFDIGKFLHFIEVTGAAQIATTAPSVSMGDLANGMRLDYRFIRPESAQAVLTLTDGFLPGLAASLGDENWRTRLNLSMASNLLGLPVGRLGPSKAGQPRNKDAAFIMYGEGLRYLAACCS